MKCDIWERAKKPQTYYQRTKGIFIRKGFQESSGTHLLEVLQEYLIQAWQQQGELCYPWKSFSVLNGSSSVHPLCNFPLKFSAASLPRLLHLAHRVHKAKEQGNGELCVLWMLVRILLVLWVAHLQPRLWLQVCAHEPRTCVFFHESGHDHIHSGGGVICLRWYLTDVTNNSLPDRMWSWLFVAMSIFLPRFVF